MEATTDGCVAKRLLPTCLGDSALLTLLEAANRLKYDSLYIRQDRMLQGAKVAGSRAATPIHMDLVREPGPEEEQEGGDV